VTERFASDAVTTTIKTVVTRSCHRMSFDSPPSRRIYELRRDEEDAHLLDQREHLGTVRGLGHQVSDDRVECILECIPPPRLDIQASKRSLDQSGAATSPKDLRMAKPVRPAVRYVGPGSSNSRPPLAAAWLQRLCARRRPVKMPVSPGPDTRAQGRQSPPHSGAACHRDNSRHWLQPRVRNGHHRLPARRATPAHAAEAHPARTLAASEQGKHHTIRTVYRKMIDILGCIGSIQDSIQCIEECRLSCGTRCGWWG